MKKFPTTNISENHLGGYIYSSKNYPHGDELTYSPHLWKWLIKKLKVNSILDIGCGEGHSTKYFSELGCDVLGIDGSKKAIKNSAIPHRVVLHDFTGGKYILNRKYDAIWCCEFVEHVEEKYKNNFLETFKFAEKYIFLTYADLGQKGWHHVNCQPKEYWIRELEKNGFEFNSKLTLAARCMAEMGHFRKKGLIFINKNYATPNFHNLFGPSMLLFNIKYKIKKILYFTDKQIGKIGLILKKSPKLYKFLKNKKQNKIWLKKIY
jgi:SAM-dependent methyltransferase